MLYQLPSLNNGNKGIFVDNYVIVSMEKSQNNPFNRDINYILKVAKSKEYHSAVVNGETPRTYFVFLQGNIKDNVLPLNVAYFLGAFGITKREDSYEIIKDFVENEGNLVKEIVVGQEIKLLKYISGVRDGYLNYKFWLPNMYLRLNPFKVDTSDEFLIKSFEKALKSKYPPNYTPEVLTDANGDVNIEHEPPF